MTLTSPLNHMQQFLEFTRTENGAHELRALPNKWIAKEEDGVIGGHYKDMAKMARDASSAGGRRYMRDVYFSLNPIKPEAQFRLLNTPCHPYTRAVRNHEIASRNLYLIDCDPERPSGVCATDDEKAKAMIVAQSVIAYLTREGWPEPILADSGNGYHLYYRGPGRDTKETQYEWKQCLIHLGEKFDPGSGVKIDTKVLNEARISRMPGTWNRKGPNTSDRPHRMAQVISYPQTWEPVQTSLLTTLANRVIGRPRTAPSSSSPGEDRRGSSKLIERIVQSVKADIVDEYPETFGEVYKETTREDGIYLALTICPHNGEAHHDQFVGYGHSCLIVSTLPNTLKEPNRFGSIGFNCFSDRCPNGRTELLKLIEEDYGDCHWSLSYCEEILPTVDEEVPYIQYKRKSPGGYDLYARVNTMDLTWEDVEATFREHAVIADGHLARCKPDGQVDFRAWAHRVITSQDLDAAASLLGQGWINDIAFPCEKRPITDAELDAFIREIEHPREIVWVP